MTLHYRQIDYAKHRTGMISEIFPLPRSLHASANIPKLPPVPCKLNIEHEKENEATTESPQSTPKRAVTSTQMVFKELFIKKKIPELPNFI